MKKKGISLILLVITIIIIIIIASAVILNLNNNNPVDKARMANVQQTRDSLKSGINLYIAKIMVKENGEHYASTMILGKNEEVESYSIIAGSYIAGTTNSVVIFGNKQVWQLDYTKVSSEVNIKLDVYDGHSRWYIDEYGNPYLVYDKLSNVSPYLKDETGNVAASVRDFVVYLDQDIEFAENIDVQNTIYIRNIEEFVAFRNDVNSGNDYAGKTIILQSDIDLNEGKYEINETTKEVVFDSNATQWIPIGNNDNKFRGAFRGNNHIIKGIYIDNSSNSQALFGIVENAKIDGIVLKDGKIKGNIEVAGIVAQVHDTEVSNCINYCDTTSIGNSAGGIVGACVLSTSFKINNCINYGNIKSGVDGAGGIITFLTTTGRCEITNCINRGKVESERYNAGGILGGTSDSAEYLLIRNCSNEGNISSIDNLSGGIIANVNCQEASIASCSNTGNVLSNKECAGGIIGIIQKISVSPLVTISNCSNDGYIESKSYHAGGILGAVVNSTLTLTDSYNLNHIKSFANIGGIVGGVTTSANCTIQNCYNDGNIECTSYNSGGIAGGCWASSTLTIENCYNRESVGATNENVGGILGVNACLGTTINNSYNNASISGQNYVSGIVGSQDGGTMSISMANCYNVGQVISSGSYTDGMIVLRGNNTKTISNCFYLNTTKSSTYATSKSSDELKSLATTLGSAYKADTNNINGGYPILTWEE